MTEYLDHLRKMHKLFYREYIESEDEWGGRDMEALALAMQAKASYYRLRLDILDPVTTIQMHYN